MSLQARAIVWVLKAGLKRRLQKSRDPLQWRKALTPPPYRLPRGVRVRGEPVGGVPGEWVEGDGDRIMLYLHGGGYFACSPKTHRPVTAGFARRGFRVFAPDYRLAPEHKFPAAVDDAVAAYRGLAAERVVVAGDSAGGGLTLALLLSLRDAGVRLPAAAVLFSPWTDLAGTGDSAVRNDKRCAMFRGAGIPLAAGHYLGAADPCNPLASPLYADLRGLPPLLIHASADEVLLDDSVRLAEKARAAGVRVELKVWPVVPHTWQLMPLIPEAKQSLDEAAQFLRTQWPL